MRPSNSAENKVYRKDKIEKLIYLKVQAQSLQSLHRETIRTWIHKNLNKHKAQSGAE